MATYIDIHAIQSVPPSNINRDDTGAPKTAIFGGVQRHRVSSQAWKKSTRDHFKAHLDPSRVGHRTLHVVEAVAHAIAAIEPDLASRSEALANDVFKAIGVKVTPPAVKAGQITSDMAKSGALFFLSTLQIQKLAQAALDAADEPNVEASLKKAKVKVALKQDHSFDIALFGRMVADSPDINVDAACQVAHALSVHEVQSDGDYFTAVDDREKENNAGADMIGVIEFSSSTLYRYATINVDALHSNLGDNDAVKECIDAFTSAFLQSMPTGKQNTFANRTLPSAVVVAIRDDQPISLINGFESPIQTTGGYVKLAVEALVTEFKGLNDNYNVAPREVFVARTSDSAVAIDSLGVKHSLATLGQATANAAVAG